MNKGTQQMPTAVGSRIKLTQDVENYPTIYAKSGLTGTLTRIDHESYWVKLDQHFDELNEWDNELQIWDWSAENEGKFHPETFIETI